MAYSGNRGKKLGGKPASKPGAKAASKPGAKAAPKSAPKAKSAASPRSADAVSARESASAGRLAWRFFAVGLSGLVAFVLLAGWNTFAALVTVPLLVGGYIGLVLRKPLAAAGTASAVGLVGGVLSALFYEPSRAVALIQRLPPWWNTDVTLAFYTGTILPIFESLHWGDAQGALWVMVASVLCGAFAAGVSWAVSRPGTPALVRTGASWALVIVLCVSFFATVDRVAAPFRAKVSVEPADRSYRYDAYVYLKTMYLMEKGMGYYPAAVEAASKDDRIAEEGGVKNGKLAGFWYTPAYVRLPTIFQLWKLMGRTASSVVRWSEVLAALSLAAVFGGFSRRLSERALMVPFVLFPWLLAHSITINAFFPDWWAALATVFAIALLAADLAIPAALVLLLGSIFRFTALPLLAVVLVTALVLLVKKDGRRQMAIVAGVGLACLAIFAVVWERHLAQAARYIDPSYLAAGRATSSGYVRSFFSRSLTQRLLTPTAYLMYAYGFGRITPVLLFPTALAGYLLALRQTRFAQIALVLFTGGWFAALVLVGPSSSYWGQMYTSALVIGTGALLGVLDTAPQTAVEVWRNAKTWLAERRGARALQGTPEAT